MLLKLTTTHLFHFRFAITEQYWHPCWLVTLTSRWTRDRDRTGSRPYSASRRTTGITMDSGRCVIAQCMDGHSVDGTTGGNTSSRASCLSDGSWTAGNCRPIIFGSFTSPSNGVASPISSFIDRVEDEGPFKPTRTISIPYRNSSVRKSEIAPSFTRWMLDVALKSSMSVFSMV